MSDFIEANEVSEIFGLDGIKSKVLNQFFSDAWTRVAIALDDFGDRRSSFEAQAFCPAPIAPAGVLPLHILGVSDQVGTVVREVMNFL
mgnify:CR=1 FL=1